MKKIIGIILSLGCFSITEPVQVKIHNKSDQAIEVNLGLRLSPRGSKQSLEQYDIKTVEVLPNNKESIELFGIKALTSIEVSEVVLQRRTGTMVGLELTKKRSDSLARMSRFTMGYDKPIELNSVDVFQASIHIVYQHGELEITLPNGTTERIRSDEGYNKAILPSMARARSSGELSHKAGQILGIEGKAPLVSRSQSPPQRETSLATRPRSDHIMHSKTPARPPRSAAAAPSRGSQGWHSGSPHSSEVVGFHRRYQEHKQSERNSCPPAQDQGQAAQSAKPQRPPRHRMPVPQQAPPRPPRPDKPA